MQMLLRLPRVEAITGLKKSQIFDAIQRGVFPRPVRILESGRAVGWLETEIAAFLESRIAARDAAQKKPGPGRRSRGQQTRNDEVEHGKNGAL
jgi:prophage regulatory protein